jgi:glutaredoxin
MSILIYSIPGCGYCDRAKMLMASKQMNYEEVIVGKDILREEFLTTFPGQKKVPLIIIDGVKIGGYSELVEYYNREPKQFLTE